MGHLWPLQSLEHVATDQLGASVVEVTVLLLSPMPKVTVPYCVLLTSPMGLAFSDIPDALKASAVGLSWECRVCGELMNAETSS